MSDESTDSGRRVTIADIARRAGVTNGAVSLAINGKPGVSPDTRERVLRIADELHWRPSYAAQTLRGKSAQSVGLVLTRPEEVVGQETFFARFITGVQAALSRRHYSLQLQMAASLEEESAIHAEWVAAGRVDGLIVLDSRVDDPRVAQLDKLGHPTIFVGGEFQGDNLASIRTDDGQFMAAILAHLTGLGHRRIGYITGEQGFSHIRDRVDRFFDVTLDEGVWGVTLPGDFEPQKAEQATARLMKAPQRPSALIFDSEIMAIAGLSTLARLGLTVPGDVSVVSWEDSQVCQVVHPSLTTLDHDAIELGRLAATDLLLLLAHEPIQQPDLHPAVVQRESTAPPAATPPPEG